MIYIILVRYEDSKKWIADHTTYTDIEKAKERIENIKSIIPNTRRDNIRQQFIIRTVKVK